MLKILNIIQIRSASGSFQSFVHLDSHGYNDGIGTISKDGKSEMIAWKSNELNSKYETPSPISFKGDKFVDSGGGFIIDVSETSKPVLRYIKYNSRFFQLICNPITKKWEPKQLTYQPLEGFEADSILVYPHQIRGNAIVFSRNEEVFVLDINRDKIHKVKNGKYFISPVDKELIFFK